MNKDVLKDLREKLAESQKQVGSLEMQNFSNIRRIQELESIIEEKVSSAEFREPEYFVKEQKAL